MKPSDKGSKNTGGVAIAPFTSIAEKQRQKLNIEVGDFLKLPMPQYSVNGVYVQNWMQYLPELPVGNPTITDLRDLYEEKIRVLMNTESQQKLRYRFDLDQTSVEHRNWIVASIINYNSGYKVVKDDHIYTIYLICKNRNWVETLNNALGTTLTEDDIWYHRNWNDVERVGEYEKGFAENQEKIIEQYKKEMDYIDFINGVYRVKPEKPEEEKKEPIKRKQHKIKKLTLTDDEKEIIERYPETYVCTNLTELRNTLLSNPEIFSGRYELLEDGTIKFELKQIPIIAVRSMNGLQALKPDMPPILFVLGPLCPERLHMQYNNFAKKIVKYEYLVKTYGWCYPFQFDDTELDYDKLSPCDISYWLLNPDKWFITNKDIVGSSTKNRSRGFNGTLYINVDGKVKYESKKNSTSWQDDPSVNPGSSLVVNPNYR